MVLFYSGKVMFFFYMFDLFIEYAFDWETAWTRI